MHKIKISADVSYLDEVFSFVNSVVEDLTADKKFKINLNVVVEEIFVNIANYAYPAGNGDAVISIFTENNKLTIEFRDTGIKFNPLEKSDPDITLSATERQIGGLGIFLVKKTVDDISYRYEKNENILTISKCWSEGM